MSVDITVIIVNYNSGARLEKCLNALSLQSYSDFEVIVVDNASSDDSQEAALHSPCKPLLLRQDKNLGFAAANNLAAKKANGVWLVTLNPDAYPEERWLEELTDARKRNPEAAAFGSTQINAGNTTILDGAGDVFHALGVPYRGHFGRRVEDAPGEGLCFAPCAAAAMYDRDIFLRLGGFDERFFCYCEDVDLGFRIRLAGYQVIQAAKARVRHEGSGITQRYSDFTVYHENRNRIWLSYKNIPGVYYWLLFPAHVAFNLILLGRAFLKGHGGAYWRALIDGYKGLPGLKESRKESDQLRKISRIEVLRFMTWSPVKLATRAADIRPISDKDKPDQR